MHNEVQHRKRGGGVTLNVAYNMDCMEYMKYLPDGAFTLAVVDPPYGIDKVFAATSRIAKYGQLESVNDRKPDGAYFEQLFRVSKNQIIFGYNHLSDMLPPTKEFLVQASACRYIFRRGISVDEFQKDCKVF